MTRRSKQERLAIEARRRLEADHLAGDISDENAAREDARITAGTSKYLEKQRKGVIDRAAHGDVGAMIRIALVFLALSTVAGLAAEVLDDEDDRPQVQQVQPQQPQLQPQPEVDDDDFGSEGFEGDDESEFDDG